jgi:hypothetical protein
MDVEAGVSTKIVHLHRQLERERFGQSEELLGLNLVDDACAQQRFEQPQLE